MEKSSRKIIGRIKLRIEIIRPRSISPDQDEIIAWLWDALNPLFKKTNGKIMVYMSSDLGKDGDKRGLVIWINGLRTDEVKIRRIIDTNPSRREFEKEI